LSALIKTYSIPGLPDITMQITCGERPWNGFSVFCCSFSRIGMANDNCITQQTFTWPDINCESYTAKLMRYWCENWWHQSNCVRIYDVSNILPNETQTTSKYWL